MTADDTYNAIKYRNYATRDLCIDGIQIPSGSVYYVNDEGRLHREGGAAIITKKNKHIYCISGVKISKSDHDRRYIPGGVSFLWIK